MAPEWLDLSHLSELSDFCTQPLFRLRNAEIHQRGLVMLNQDRPRLTCCKDRPRHQQWPAARCQRQPALDGRLERTGALMSTSGRSKTISARSLG